jgi:hypothetical protein
MPQKALTFECERFFVNRPGLEMPAELSEMRQVAKIDSVNGNYRVPESQKERWDQLRQSLKAKIMPIWENPLFMPIKEFLSDSWMAAEQTCLWIDDSRSENWLPEDAPDAWNIVLFWTPEIIMGIRGAIREEHPYFWPDYDTIDTPYPRGDSRLYLFGDYVWRRSSKERLMGEDDFCLVIQDAVNRERRKIARLRKTVKAGKAAPEFTSREAIEEEVRIFVWQRDNGCCVKCGSQERLEFDHVIPVSKGGSSTARNIQILCERCNREKGDSI